MPCFQYCVKSPKHPFHTWSSPKKNGVPFPTAKVGIQWYSAMVPSILNFSYQILHVWSKFFLYSQSICSFTHWWNHLVHPQRKWRNIGWTELPTLGCTAANLSKANGWFHPTPFGHSRVVFRGAAVFMRSNVIKEPSLWGPWFLVPSSSNCSTDIALTILGSWYWTDWTHNRKTLKEIIESHVCRCHMTLHLDFCHRNFMANFPESWGPWLCAATMHGLLLQKPRETRGKWQLDHPKKVVKAALVCYINDPHRKVFFLKYPETNRTYRTWNMNPRHNQQKNQQNTSFLGPLWPSYILDVLTYKSSADTKPAFSHLECIGYSNPSGMAPSTTPPPVTSRGSTGVSF